MPNKTMPSISSSESSLPLHTQSANLMVADIRALRRYAAALTGASTSGDAYVIACLEAILAAPHLIDRTVPLRIALFRAFSAIWSSANTDREYMTSMPGYKPLFVLLQMLDSVSRQAVLLTTLGGFSYEQAGQILHYTPDDMRNICLTASNFLQSQTDDDEPQDDEDEEEDGAISEPFFPPADAYFKGSLAWRWVQAQRS